MLLHQGADRGTRGPRGGGFQHLVDALNHLCCLCTLVKKPLIFPFQITRPANTNAIAGYANAILKVRRLFHWPRHLVSRSSAFRRFCAASTSDRRCGDDRELRPLTQEQRQGARNSARDAVIRSFGPKPTREQFTHTSATNYPSVTITARL
jgi:hypothetical protein